MNHAAKFLFEAQRSLAEDHLRAEITAIDAPIQHGSCDNHKQQEHQREKDNRKLIDPKFVAGKVKPLMGNVKAHQVQKWQRDEDYDAKAMNQFAFAMVAPA